MNAVNLIPLESRRGDTLSLPGVPFLGVIGALGLVLAGSVLYVEARNEVSTRQSELTHIQAGTTQWTTAAARYAPDVATVKHHAKSYVQLGALLGERADWSLVLGQLAEVMPAHAELSTLSATAAGPTGGTTSGAAPSSSTSTAGAGSGIQISGCAASQPVVADTLVALRRLSGVSSVSLSSSSLQSAGGSGGAATSGTCALPVKFSVTVQFTPPNPLVQKFEGGGAGGSATETSTPSQAATSSDTTGAVQ